MHVIWKRNVTVMNPSDDDWNENGPNADGSYTYTSIQSGDVTCEWENGRSEEDRNLPVGSTITYWPDTGKVKITHD